MLVLQRDVSEGLTILVDGREIHLVVVKLSGGGVKLGIEAEPDVIVLRDELRRAAKFIGPHKKG